MAQTFKHCFRFYLLSAFLFASIALAAPPDSLLNSTASAQQHCRIENYPFAIACGQLRVPIAAAERYPHQNSTLILTWYKVPARARYPKEDPIIWIADGLGTNATQRAPGIIQALTRSLNTRDFIWLEVRGTQAVETKKTEHCNLVLPTTITQSIDHFSNAAHLQSCHQVLQKQGGLASFTPQQLASDYERLSQVLKIKQANIFAEGKGAEIAHAWASLAPKRIRSMIFDSPSNNMRHAVSREAIQLATAWQKLVAQCEVEQACRSRFPDLNASLSSIQAQLPISVQLKNPQTHQLEKTTIEAHTFAILMKNIMQNPERAIGLPSAIHQAKQANWQPIITMHSQNWLSPLAKLSDSLNLASQCQAFAAENGVALQQNTLSPPALLPADVLKHAQWFYQASHARLAKTCAPLMTQNTLHHTAQTQPVQVPTLLLQGLLDPLLAASWPIAEPKQTVIQSPYAGHHLISYSCTRDIIFRYFNLSAWQNVTPSTLQADCLIQVPYPTLSAHNTLERMP